MSLPLLLIETGNVPSQIAPLGNFSDMFLRTAHCSNCPVKILHPVKDPLPDSPDKFSGILVSGSPAMVTDHADWSEKLGAWLKRAVCSGSKVLGVCYGHQLIAHAFGGVVDYNPTGIELGTHIIDMCPQAQNHPLLQGLPQTFAANLAHSQSVITPPAKATVLGFSCYDLHQILSYGDNTITLQFHPEFDAAVMQAYVDMKTAEGSKQDANMGLPVQETPVPALLLQRFFNSLN